MIRKYWRTLFVMLSMVTDTMAIISAALIAFTVREFLPGSPTLPLTTFALSTLFFGAVLIGVGLILGQYRTIFHSNTSHLSFLAAKSYLISVLIVLSTFYVLHIYDFPRRFTFLFFLSLPFTYSFGRFLINSLNERMSRKGIGLHRALLVGYENGGEQVFARFQHFPELQYQVVGVVARTKEPHMTSVRLNGDTLPLFRVEELSEVVERERIDRVFLPNAKVLDRSYPEILDICQRSRIKMKVLSEDADGLLRLARVHDIAGIALYSPPRPLVHMTRRTFKRLFDFVGALFLLLVLSPVFLATSVAILIESGFPVFFNQRRSAVKGGKEFDFIKFRSMIQNADELKSTLFQFNESSGALFKMKNDPRMTRVGKFLRKYSIDELPQLFNVLRGEMSLVGPRPLPIADFDNVQEGPEYWQLVRERASVKPGMTGLWQVSGRSKIGFKEMVLLDLYYVENQSLLFDIEILFATIPVVLFGKGAY